MSTNVYLLGWSLIIVIHAIIYVVFGTFIRVKFLAELYILLVLTIVHCVGAVS